jgi:N6-L-threonylcarbamoyladenine synthase
MKTMHILGIETSCDETSAAVLSGEPEVLSSIVLSQDEIHAPYGGVVPELASRRHIKTIDSIVSESLTRAKARIEEIDAYAVTQGPGLIGSLLVGLSYAKGLAYYFKKPLLGIDHLEAHVEAAFLENKSIPFPVLALLVSGGHTSLFFLKKKLDYRLLGRTRDDAAGEALDKIAKFLGLGYPGGPVIERLAAEGDPRKFSFARPRMKDRGLDFSFSGLKTAALKHIRETGISKGHSLLADFLASFEEAVADALLENLRQGVEEHRPEALVLCGGVARNRRLRERFLETARDMDLPPFIPSPRMCTDNAAMVAALALKKMQAKKPSTLDLDIDAYPRTDYRASE